MKKQLPAASSQLPVVPKPHAVACPECGHDAVDIPFFSPRVHGVDHVRVCSACNSTFYPKAEKLLHEAAA